MKRKNNYCIAMLQKGNSQKDVLANIVRRLMINIGLAFERNGTIWQSKLLLHFIHP
jgi:hypothetical protein